METKKDENILFLGNYKNPDFVPKLTQAIKRALAEILNSDSERAVALCIGSDKNIADCFGPLCGNMLKDSGVMHVYGSLEKPIHMNNLRYYADNIAYSFPLAHIISIDAAQSAEDEIGDVYLIRGAIVPGAANGYSDYSVGELTIVCVTEKEPFSQRANEKVRLNEVISMAASVCSALTGAVKLSGQRSKSLSRNAVVN